MSKRLTALDATFLELEEIDQSAHMHIGGVMVFEPYRDGEAPPLDLLRAQLGSRMHAMPLFAKRLSEPRTGGLSWPRWIEDPRFDPARHFRRARLPAPGGEAELLEWAAEFFSERLDRARPLWEMVLVEGLADGRWVLASKTHHCLVDGVGSVDIAHLLLDPSPEGTPEDLVPSPPEEDEGDAAEPGGLRGLVAMPLRLVAGAAGFAGRVVDTATHPARARAALRSSRAMADVLIRDELIAAPATSVNQPIGAKRRLGVAQAELAELKRIKSVLGGTVNDVVLAAAAGGMRRLLLARGEHLPARGLRAMVPVNVREASQRFTLGNRITSLFVALPVADADPLRRYRVQVEKAEALKSGTQAVGTTGIINLTSRIPPIAHSFIARSLYATRLFNLTITNVPGPQMPLYALGSRLEAVWPLVPLAAEHALGLAVFSYDGTLFFTVNADRDSMPDLDLLVSGIEDSIAELSELAESRASVSAGAPQAPPGR